MNTPDFNSGNLFEGANLQATVILKADADCVVLCDGKESHRLQRNLPQQIKVTEGTHIFSFIPNKNRKIITEKSIICSTDNNNIVYVDDLSLLLQEKPSVFALLFKRKKIANDYFVYAKKIQQEGKTSNYIKWLEKSAKLGNKDAMFDLAEQLTSSESPQEYIEKGLRWYKKGALLGHIGCLDQMAMYYLINEKYIKAENCAKIPSKRGYLNSIAVKGICLYNQGMHLENETTFAEAFAFLKIAFAPQTNQHYHPLDKNFVPIVKVFLGYCYLLKDTPGVPFNKEKGLALLQQAVDDGYVAVEGILNDLKQTLSSNEPKNPRRMAGSCRL